MKLRLYQPVMSDLSGGLQHWIEDMDRYFERAFPLNMLRQWAQESRHHQPAVDLYEDGGNYYAKIECPGFRKEDLKVEVEGRILRIEGHRKEAREQVDFERRIELSDETNPDKIDAQYQDGILSLTLPKREDVRQPKPRTITIQ